MTEANTLASRLQPYKAVLFDLDGTLVRLRVDWEGVRRDLAAALQPAVGGAGSSLGVAMLLTEATKTLGPKAKQIAASVMAPYEQDATIEPIPLGLELFRLAQQQAEVGIVSNNLHDTVARSLTACKVSTTGVTIVGFDNVDRIKPAPEGLVKALAVLDTQAEASLYIGDAATDKVAAEAAGTAFLHVNQAATLRRQGRL